MRCIVFSDLHMHNFKEFSRIDRMFGLNTRLLDSSNILMQIKNYCLENNIKTVIFCGDFFHKSNEITPDVYYLAINSISSFKKEGIKIIAIPGQHDYYKDLFTSLSPLFGLMKTLGLSGGKIEEEGVVFHACLNAYTVEKQKEELSICKPIEGKKNILLGHFLVKEILENGLYNLDLPCVTYDDLPKGFDLYILGDYHPHVYLPDKKLISVGATHHHTFGSVKRGRGGFLDLDLETLTFERIELDAPIFVDVDDFKNFEFNDKDFYRVKVSDESDIEELVNKIDGVDVKYRPSYDTKAKAELSKEEKEEYRIDMDPIEVMYKYLEKCDKPKSWIEKGKGYLNV
jgi:DNA repair exonuclease SbcCD nuclease subunit